MVEAVSLEKLSVYFPVRGGTVKAVDDVTVSFAPHSYTAIIGESGCGKSVLGQAVLGILPAGVIKKGAVKFGRCNLLNELPADYYGKIMSIVPQNPSESLNPIRSIKKQMLDVLGAEENAEHSIAEQLKYFGLEDYERVLAAYPCELSGGMQQRVLCAMALLKRPEWILADEPTKGLDEETAALVYANLKKIKAAGNCGMLIITHDIALAKTLCDRIAVMYAGQILEIGPAVLRRPLHPYTQAFVASLPENGFVPLDGLAPGPGEELQGCRFAARCRHCGRRCLESVPEMYEIDGAKVRCFLYAEG